MQFWNITNWLIGFVGLALAIWSLVRSREVKRVVIGHRSIDAAAAIPTNSIQPRYFVQSGEIVDKIYLSYFYVLNKGTKTVGAEDFRSVFTVRMSAVRDVRVFEWAVSGGRQSAGLEIEKSDDAAEWTIRWSHLDPGQSITVEAYTDVFVESVVSDGDFSYQTKFVDADKHSRRQHALMVGSLLLLGSLLFLWRPIYYMLSTGKIVDLKEERWSYIPYYLLTVLVFWLISMALSWVVDQFKPGPRYIPPVA